MGSKSGLKSIYLVEAMSKKATVEALGQYLFFMHFNKFALSIGEKINSVAKSVR